MYKNYLSRLPPIYLDYPLTRTSVYLELTPWCGEHFCQNTLIFSVYLKSLSLEPISLLSRSSL